MSKTCCVPNCKLKNDDPGCLKLHFFQVPRNEDLKKKWYESIKKYFEQEVQLKKYTYVCERHFEIKCFNYGPLCKNLRLVKGSYPTIFENYDNRAQQQLPLAKEISEHELQICNDRVHKEALHSISVNESNLSEMSVSISQELDQNDLNERDSCGNSSHLSENDFCDNSTTDEKDIELTVANQSIFSEKSKNSILKSISNIDLQSIDYTNENLVRKIIANAQAECIKLRRRLRVQTMKLYQERKQVINFNSL